MIRSLLFVCHGNICRSPMAERLMRDLLTKTGLSDSVRVSSAAVSSEELGNPIYPPARAELRRRGLPCDGHTARKLTKKDYAEYDLLIGMDRSNLAVMRRDAPPGCEKKICRLMDLTEHPGDVPDPWYTGDYETVWRCLTEGCEAIVRLIRENS